MASKSPSGLVRYIRDELLAPWAATRSTACDVKWRQNIDAFNSIDTAVWKKGEAGTEKGDEWRSKTFLAVTKIKIMAAWSLIIDILLQNGRIPFVLKPSPWDELSFDSLPPEAQDKVRKTINEMVSLMAQQFVDCHADRQIMKGVLSAAIYGEAWAKFYVHTVRRSGYMPVDVSGMGDPRFIRYVPYDQQVPAPAFEYVPVWEVFRDPESEDLQKGKGVIQRQMISPYALRKKIGEDGYDQEGIENALKESKNYSNPSDTESMPPYHKQLGTHKKTIQHLECWVCVPRVYVEDYEGGVDVHGTSAAADAIESGDEVEIMCEIAGEHIIRFARNDVVKRPYYRTVWEIKLDHIEANGIADSLKDIQLVLNGMIRAFEDNMKLSANVIIATKRDLLNDYDGVIKPGLSLDLADNCDDANKAFQSVVIPNIGRVLLEGIGLNERFADEMSQLPRILQGDVAEKKKPDTAFELNTLQQNAGKYIGGVIKNLDEGWIEPIAEAFYRYNMDDPEVKKGKGNFVAEALGFAAFQDKVIRTSNILKGVQLASSTTAFDAEVNHRAILEELWRIFDLDPKTTLLTPEQKEARAQAQAQAQALQDRVTAAEAAKKESQAAMTAARAETEPVNAQAKIAKVQAENEKLKISRAKTVNDMRRGPEAKPSALPLRMSPAPSWRLTQRGAI